MPMILMRMGNGTWTSSNTKSRLAIMLAKHFEEGGDCASVDKILSWEWPACFGSWAGNGYMNLESSQAFTNISRQLSRPLRSHWLAPVSFSIKEAP